VAARGGGAGIAGEGGMGRQVPALVRVRPREAKAAAARVGERRACRGRAAGGGVGSGTGKQWRRQ
jgi:hypothetical protein